MNKYNKVSKEEKAKIVMIVLRGEKTVNEIASQYSIHPNLISRWKQRAVNNLAELLGMSVRILTERHIRNRRTRLNN